jgi:hypothetical protein
MNSPNHPTTLPAALADALWALVDSLRAKHLADHAAALAVLTVFAVMLWAMQRSLRPWVTLWQQILDWVSWIAGAAFGIVFATALWRSTPLGPLAVPLAFAYAAYAAKTLRNFASREVHLTARVRRVRRDGYRGDWQECDCVASQAVCRNVWIPPLLAEPGCQVTLALRRSILTGRHFGRAYFHDIPGGVGADHASA